MAYAAIHNLEPGGEVQAGEKSSSEKSLKYLCYFFGPAKDFKALIRLKKKTLVVGFTALLQLTWLKTLGVAEEDEIEGQCDEPKGWF